MKAFKQAALIKDYLYLKYLKKFKEKQSPLPKVSSKRPRTRSSMPAARLTPTLQKCALEKN